MTIEEIKNWIKNNRPEHRLMTNMVLRQEAVKLAEFYNDVIVKNCSIRDVVGSAYFAAKGMDEVVVLAKNIADAMDKLEESKENYKLITAKSYEIIK